VLDFNTLIWKIASPTWGFDDLAFDGTLAEAPGIPDHGVEGHHRRAHASASVRVNAKLACVTLSKEPLRFANNFTSARGAR